MRIVVNARFLSQSTTQGVGRYTYEVLRRMVNQHQQDHFILLYDRDYSSDLANHANVTERVVRPHARHPYLWYVWFEWRIPTVLQQERSDCFLSFDSFASTRTDVPTVIISHDIAYHHYPEHLRSSHLKYYKKWFPRYHRRADRIVAVSRYTANDIVDVYGLYPAKVTVGYNAVSHIESRVSTSDKEALRHSITGGQEYFVYLGSVHPRKNILNLIKAFDLYRRSGGDHHLVLIGHFAWKTEAIRDAMRSSSYADSIHHLEGVGALAYDIVAAAKGMVYVSLFEGFGIPLLEAMSVDTPVITSSVGSMPEVAGDAALLVDPQKPKAIADAMLKIHRDGKTAKDLIKRGRERLNIFDWHATADVVHKACLLSTIRKMKS